MQTISKLEIKKELAKVLSQQGYNVGKTMFALSSSHQKTLKNVHSLAKSERIIKKKDFINNKVSFIEKTLLNGSDLDVKKISPKLIEVEVGSQWATIFNWWNLVWWSLPYERAYGRQIRYVVWDQYHNAPIGLIGLQSPILSWNVRDNYLHITKENRDYWVNQSLSAQRLGALPPYNDILGGKLVAYLMTADTVREKFKEKYSAVKTLIQKRELPANLLFITTTGAYGKSSVYTRLKYKYENTATLIGYSNGNGSFHIPNTLFDQLVKLLHQEGYNVCRGFGNGPSRKMRLIDQSLKLLGFENGSSHGIKRAVYLFPLAKNLSDVIQNNASPNWYHRNVEELTQYWKNRWAIPRSTNNKVYKEFNSSIFIKNMLAELNKQKGIS